MHLPKLAKTPVVKPGRFNALELARRAYDLILMARNEAKARELQLEIGNAEES